MARLIAGAEVYSANNVNGAMRTFLVVDNQACRWDSKAGRWIPADVKAAQLRRQIPSKTETFKKVY